MIPLAFRLRSTFLLIAITALGVFTARAEDDTSGKLSDFLKRMTAQSSASSSNAGYQENAAAQFKMLQSALKRGDYERAQQLLQNASGYGIPPQMQDEWSDLADKIAAQLQQLQLDAAVKWKAQVDDLVKRTRAACLAAKTSDDLTVVMIDCSALQIKRINQSSILAQRAGQQLEGVVQILQVWSNFLDARADGNSKQANNILRQMLSNSGNGAAVIPRDAIEKCLLPEQPDSLSPDEAVRTALREVKSVGDLPAAIEQLKKLIAAPTFQQNDYVRQDIERLQALTEAATLITQKKYDSAASSIEQFNNGGGYGGSNNAVKSIVSDLQKQIAVARVAELVKQQPGADESFDIFLKRMADQLSAEHKYADLVVMINAVSAANLRLPSGSIPLPWSSSDAQALKAYSAGSQFEAAGDILPAINQYRIVIAVGQGAPYAPTAEAQKALEKLKTSNPEALKDVNNAVLAQLQSIQDQLRSLPTMMNRGNFPPGYPR